MNPIRLIIDSQGEYTENPGDVHAVTNMYGDYAVLCTGDMYLSGTLSLGMNLNPEESNYIEVPTSTPITCPACIAKMQTLTSSFVWPADVKVKRASRPRTPRPRSKPLPKTATAMTMLERVEDGRIHLCYKNVDEWPEPDLQAAWDRNRHLLNAPGIIVNCVRTGDRCTFILGNSQVQGIHINY